MIRTAIVDDEPKVRSTVIDLLDKFCPDIQVVGEAASGDEAYILSQTIKPGLFFLDIEMPHGNAFDFLKKFDHIDFEVIFITAYDQYAIQAIRMCALDYLMKPVSITELQDAVEKARRRISDKSSGRQYDQLIHHIRWNQSSLNKLAVPTREGLDFTDVKDIVRMEADGGYTNIFTAHGRKMVSTRHLKEYEDILPATLFFRSHHSHLINLQHIRNYHKGEGGYVVMSDQSVVDIAKRKKKEFLELFHI